MTGPTVERVQANDRRSQKGVDAAKICKLGDSDLDRTLLRYEALG